MGLLPTDFKPPPTQVVQACALNTGHDGHDGQELRTLVICNDCLMKMR